MASTRCITKTLLALSLLAPVALAGCDGYTPVPYNGVPYGGSRTAGTGIAYVKAKLMSERGPVLKAAQPENKELLEETKPVEPVVAVPPMEEVAPIVAPATTQAADRVFNDMQKK